MKKRIPALILTLCLLLSTAAYAAVPSSDEHMRGVWVSSVFNLDYPAKPTTDAAALRKQADTALNNIQSMGLNTVFLQVHPSTDALYPSKIYPWSRFLTGSVGTAPSGGFDPLRYWIDGAHARGLELHAWLNPYRITTGKKAEWDALPASHPAKQHADWVVPYNGNYYWNPGIPGVVDLLESGVREILDNYPDVDGIHMDDYFYPGTTFDDAATYKTYGSGLGLADWRRANVNTLVNRIHTLIHQKNPAASFGISPSGVWENRSADPRGSATSGGNPSYSQAYADTLTWIEQGMVDYVCPQLYWYIGQSAADYAVLTDWWANAVKGSGVKLYIGEAAYKCGDTSQAALWQTTGELTRHLKLCAARAEVSGNIFFSYGSLRDKSAFANEIRTYYASLPSTSEATPTPPATDDNSAQLVGMASYLHTLGLFLQSILR